MIDQILKQALIEQMNRERENEAFYQAIADYLAGQAWPGFSRWFERQAGDERDHARRIANYLIEQNETPQHTELPAPIFMTGSVLELYRQALERERATTEQIDQLYQLSELRESPATCEFLLWFVREQVEEENTVLDQVKRLERADCSAALLILDQQAMKD